MKTKILKVHPEFPEIQHIAECAKILRQGGLVVFPTETVYGIAVDFSNSKAVERLRALKQRSEEKHFSILISQKALISNYTAANNPMIYKLIDQYWPGPLTIVVPSHEEGQTVGVRMPDNLIALKFLQESPFPVAAPSANIEGKPPPLTCQDALKDLDGLVDIAIDGGPARIGEGSSVVDLTGKEPVILREGPISGEDINKTANMKTVLFVCTGNSCRSVMAHYYMESLLAGRKDVKVESAGTGVFIHARASSETIAVLRDEGIDATHHQSQSISTVLLKKADLIIVMTRSHRQQVLERAPSVEKRVYLLREFANVPPGFKTELDIPDPIGQTNHEYKHCLGVIKESVMKLRDLL